MEHKIKLTAAALLAAALLTAEAPAAEKVYRWVDENGEVHYSETLPPGFKDQGHDILNEQGIVLDEDQSLTPPPPEPIPEEEKLQELPRDASGLPRPKALYSEAEMQRRMDNFLMLRYDSEQEIVDAMNVEIKQLAYDRRLLETSRESMFVAYRGQIAEAADSQRSGKPVDESVFGEISALQAQLAESNRLLAGLQAREENIRADFQKQLDRYRYLQESWEEQAEGG
jgi:hypothetical protein